MSSHEKLKAGGYDYACVYCGQHCTSVEILMSHERDCIKRRQREREWRLERQRHTGHLAGIRRHEKEGEDSGD